MAEVRAELGKLLVVAAFLALSAAATGAMAQDAATAPEPDTSAPVAAPAPAKPIPTMKFSQQQTIVQPSEIRIGPGIACRMDDTVLVCDRARPAIPEKE